jgi:transposase-like protein
MDRGIHVHARFDDQDEKEIDRTFRAVRVNGERLPDEGILVSELEAIYYMVARVFEYEMRYVSCSYCGYPHLDKDYFSVHPHRRHLCAGCGKHFRDVRVAVGNPVVGIQEACGVVPGKPKLSTKKLDIKQENFPGGIQIWGSNPALLWTSGRQEAEGIHVHAFPENGGKPDPDETFGEVTIDGFRLDPVMVRVLMAQSALPSIKGRVRHLVCPFCDHPHFSRGELAFTPSAKHSCESCGREFSASGRLRNTIGNPLLGVLANLAKNAPRQPQAYDLGLLTETL